MKTTLVVMAAGIGSRYGKGIKQLERVGVSGETIPEYSIYDAINAGFDKVVFIIREELLEGFKQVIGPEVTKKIDVEYVFQKLTNVPNGFTVPEERVKPWGTGHAILSCLGAVKEPFAVINADDYYGKEAFVKMHEFLVNNQLEEKSGTNVKMHFGMINFVLKNTLSENGVVTRGVCKINDQSMLTEIKETFKIKACKDKAVGENGNGEEVEIPLDSPVSMNLWGFPGGFIDELEKRFEVFLNGMGDKKTSAEFLLPQIVADMIKEGRADVKALTSNDKWFGVTYAEDKEKVVEAFANMYEKGVYPKALFE